jgi:hypothetical protein
MTCAVEMGSVGIVRMFHYDRLRNSGYITVIISTSSCSVGSTDRRDL